MKSLIGISFILAMIALGSSMPVAFSPYRGGSRPARLSC